MTQEPPPINQWQWQWQRLLTSDSLLIACLFPLIVILLFITPGLFSKATFSSLLSLFSLPTSKSPQPNSPFSPFSRQAAYKSYTSYPLLARSELTQMRRSYGTLSRAHKRVGYEILGYPRKLDRVQDAIDVNEVVTCSIAGLMRDEYHELADSSSSLSWWELLLELGQRRGGAGNVGNVGRVREALKHFVRDWSEEGKEERDRMFEPILDVLRRDLGVDSGDNGDRRAGKTVLVPGCGLGRLAWEISRLGMHSLPFRSLLPFIFHFTTNPQNRPDLPQYRLQYNSKRPISLYDLRSSISPLLQNNTNTQPTRPLSFLQLVLASTHYRRCF